MSNLKLPKEDRQTVDSITRFGDTMVSNMTLSSARLRPMGSEFEHSRSQSRSRSQLQSPKTTPMLSIDEPPKQQKLSKWIIHFSTLSFAGIMLGYSAQSNLGTSELLRHGMLPKHVPLAFLVAPISGLLMQPLIGHLTDKMHTRRPFILLGAIATSLSLVLFSRASGITSAVIAFFALDLSLQVVQAPVRAIVTDGVPLSQRSEAAGALAAWAAIGQLFAGALAGYVDRWRFWWKTDASAVIEVSALFIILLILPCALLAPDSPANEKIFNCDDVEEGNLQDGNNENNSYIKWLKLLPRPFWQAFIVQLCTWSGYFATAVYANAWVGTEIYHGDGNAPATSPERMKFEAGVRFGSSSTAIAAVISLVSSVMLPKLPASFKLRHVYIASQIIESISLLTPLIFGKYATKTIALLSISSFGFVTAATNCLPWLLVAEALQSNSWCRAHVGVYTTVFNVSQGLPQLILGLFAPLAEGKGALVMGAAGILAMIGAMLISVLNVDRLDDGRVIPINASL